MISWCFEKRSPVVQAGLELSSGLKTTCTSDPLASTSQMLQQVCVTARKCDCFQTLSALNSESLGNKNKFFIQ